MPFSTSTERVLPKIANARLGLPDAAELRGCWRGGADCSNTSAPIPTPANPRTAPLLGTFHIPAHCQASITQPGCRKVTPGIRGEAEEAGCECCSGIRQVSETLCQGLCCHKDLCSWECSRECWMWPQGDKGQSKQQQSLGHFTGALHSHRILEYPQLEEIHKDHRVQLLILHRTT